jgi:cytochrome P450
MKLNYVADGIPAHVPPELVHPYPLGRRRTIYENPYETIIPELHKAPAIFMAPDAYLSVSPAWIFRRAEDIKKVFNDTESFIKKGNTNFAQMIGEEWDVIPTELDPPRHTAVRKALNPMFTPATVGAFEHKVRQRAQEYIAAFKDRGHCDFFKEFAVPYPVSIFLDLLGLPVDRMAEFLEWEYALIHASEIDDRAAGVRAVKAYLMEAIEERRKRPTDDLISHAMNLEVNGEKLSPIEVFGHCFNLYIGGLDTVSANCGLHFMHLATHQEDQAKLRAEPKLIPKAMMELLRAYSATSHQRICAKDVVIGGVQIKAGDRVVVSMSLAGRDPDMYDEPNEIRFDRNASNLTFGWGIHRCLGVYLAQRELLFAMEEMLSTVPQFRLEEGFVIPFRVGSVIQASSLPLEW